MIESQNGGGGIERVPTLEDYQRWLKRRCVSGNWFICFDDFLEILSIEAAWVLQRIINLGKRPPKTKLDKKLREDGWVRMSEDYLTRKTRLKRNAQDRILNELRGIVVTKIKEGTQVKNGVKVPVFRKVRKKVAGKPVLIETRKFGSPGRRYVKVDLVAIEVAIDAALAERGAGAGGNSPGQDGEGSKGNIPPTDRRESPPTYTKERFPNTTVLEETNGRASPAGGCAPAGFGTPAKQPSHAYTLAERLLAVLVKYNQRFIAPDNLSAWARAFGKLLRHRTYEEVSATLEGYDRHFRQQYCPRLLSANTFCDFERYQRLEAALARFEQAPEDEVIATPAAEELAGELATDWDWKGSAAQLPAAAQKTLDFFHLFLEKTLPRMEARGDEMAKARFTGLRENMLSARILAERWLGYVGRRYTRWPEWPGDIKTPSFTDKEFCNWFVKSFVEGWSAGQLNQFFVSVKE